MIRRVMRITTTDATQTELSQDGAAVTGTAILTSTRHILLASQTIMATVRVLGTTANGANAGAYERRCIIKRDASNNTSLTGSVQTLGTDIESDAGWDVTLAADDTNESLQVLVTGAAATNIRWVAEVTAVEVGFP